ncbi:MAG: tRNA guanosine(15) transglycosylase TgtA [Promethearchaeota archaeon]
MNYDGIIATDSGAFQQYMYNKDSFDLDATTIERFQEDIGSDFPVILDIPVQLEDNYEIAKQKVNTTIERAKDNISRRSRQNCYWFGPLHGGTHFELLKKSTIEMSKLDFGIYAVGGIVKALLNYRFDLTTQILLTVKQYIVPNKPVHMFGLGLPQYFSLAVACGCDLMDSAAYILFAKENRYFTLSTGTKKLEELKEFPCHCPICVKYTPNELMGFEEDLRIQLLAKHNLYLSFSELKTIRQAIREGNLWELVEQRIRNHPNLVKAASLIKKNRPLFEVYEKIYKNHGRLYSSKESVDRPLIYRYEQKLLNNYRPPKDAQYFIVLPELDVKGKTSPTIYKWLGEINNSDLIKREQIHLAFYSIIYGIIPYELIDSFPMGQYETSSTYGKNDFSYQNSIETAKKFLDKFSTTYEKCGLLIPDFYLNQFGETMQFPENHPIRGLNVILKRVYSSNFSVFSQIKDILHFFKEK